MRYLLDENVSGRLRHAIRRHNLGGQFTIDVICVGEPPVVLLTSCFFASREDFRPPSGLSRRRHDFALYQEAQHPIPPPSLSRRSPFMGSGETSSAGVAREVFGRSAESSLRRDKPNGGVIVPSEPWDIGAMP